MQTVVRSAIDYEQLKQVTEGRVIEIVIKEDRIGYLAQLMNFDRNGTIFLPISQQRHIQQMWQTEDWGDDANRTMVLRPGHNWDRYHFEGRSRSYLDSLKVRNRN